MKNQRVRIVEKGWAGYTGMLGSVEFKDGISVEAPNSKELSQIGSIVRIETCDSDEQAGAAAVLQNSLHTPAPSNVTLPKPQANDDQVGAQSESQPAAKRTREQLEQIADAKGIAGLREIADPMGVKGRGIAELIAEILAAQDKVSS
jgi:hypothetical protein